MTAAAMTNQINAIIALVRSSSASIPPLHVARPDTLKGVDDLIHAGLEAYRSSCFNWLLAATGLVVIGLVLEGPELWHEIVSIIRHWFHSSPLEERTPDWAKLLAFIGWVLIIVGVAGEYVADSFVSKADGYVQAFDEILLTDAQRQAGNAAASAKTAHEEAAAVKGIADASRKDSLFAKEQATRAESHLADARKEAASAQAELNLLRAPRSLTNVPDLISALKPFEGTQFGFISVDGDQESKDLAEEIAAALQTAGWKPAYSPTTGRANMFFWMKNFKIGAIGIGEGTGVHIGATSEEDIEALEKLPPSNSPQQIKAALALRDALAMSIFPKQDDLATDPIVVQKFGKTLEVTIEVGNKSQTKRIKNLGSH